MKLRGSSPRWNSARSSFSAQGEKGCGTSRSHTVRAASGEASWMNRSRNTSHAHATVLSGLAAAAAPNASVWSWGKLSLTLAPSSTTNAVWNTSRARRSGISWETRLTTEPPKLWPDQHHVTQVAPLDEVDHRPHVVLVADPGAGRTRLVTGVGRRVDVVAELAQAPRRRLPRPAAVP